ncbi:MAG: STAS-like domain-containing protein, partial [Bacilli bacterium]
MEISLTITNHIPSAYSNEDGYIVRDEILKHIQKNNVVILSFQGISFASSSFINSAIIELLDYVDLTTLKTHLKIVHSNSQINKLIDQRMAFELKRRANT